MTAWTGSIAEGLFETLEGDAGVASVVADRISPYVRNRDDDFPAVVYSVPREEFVGGSTDIGGGRVAEVEVSALARTLSAADNLAEKIVAALVSASLANSTCLGGIRVVSLERDFLDAYDGSVSLIYRTTVRGSVYVSGT